jgi:hypothetical protein
VVRGLSRGGALCGSSPVLGNRADATVLAHPDDSRGADRQDLRGPGEQVSDRRQQVPDRLRSAAVAHHVRGQEVLKGDDKGSEVQIGIRGSLSVADMWQFSYDSGMRVISIEEFHDKGWRWAAEEARKVINGGSAYLSFDVDSLDPVYAPGRDAGVSFPSINAPRAI